MVTPFDESGAVLYPQFERNIDRYIEAGIRGFLVLGSTGESVYLEHSEKLKLLRASRARVPQSMTLFAGTGLESTQATIALTREAADCGVDAVLVKNPSYFRSQMTFEVYRRHFLAVLDASPVPVIIYNVPVFTGIPLASKLVIELAKHQNCRGLKDSSGDPRLISEVAWNTDPEKFSIVAGAAAILLPAMAAGARGGVVALACAAPRAMIALYEAFAAGDFTRAGAVQRLVSPAALAVTERHSFPGLKAAMDMEGFEGGISRLPLLPLRPEQREDLAQIFRKMNDEIAELAPYV